MANLNFADLDLLFLVISFFEGLNTLFLYSLNKASLMIFIFRKIS